MEQLHPDDAREHLAHVLRALAPQGEYICAARASALELRRRLLEAGFSKVLCYLGAARIPWAAQSFIPKNRVRLCAVK
jgi:hypothetical protein